MDWRIVIRILARSGLLVLLDRHRYMDVSSSSIGVGQTLKSLFGQVASWQGSDG